jgi:hypothetical protein
MDCPACGPVHVARGIALAVVLLSPGNNQIGKAVTKPVHPIKKMRQGILNLFDESVQEFLDEDERIRIDRSIARHVKPLLDALEFDHTPVGTQVKYDEDCETCHLLAAWRAKL